AGIRLASPRRVRRPSDVNSGRISWSTLRSLFSSARHEVVLDSFNDLIRPQQERWRDREAERLRGLHIEDQLELRRLLDREVGGLGALENAIRVHGRPSSKRAIAWSVRD